MIYLLCLQKYVKEVLNKQDYDYEANIFAVETSFNHASRRFKINQAYIDEGIKEFKELICRYAYHKQYGDNFKFPDDDN